MVASPGRIVSIFAYKALGFRFIIPYKLCTVNCFSLSCYKCNIFDNLGSRHDTLGGVGGFKFLIGSNFQWVIWLDLVPVLCQTWLVNRVTVHRVDLLQAFGQWINLFTFWLTCHSCLYLIFCPCFMTAILDFLRDRLVLVDTAFISLCSVLDKTSSSDRPVWRSSPSRNPQPLCLHIHKILVHLVDRVNIVKLLFQKITVQILNILIAGGRDRLPVKIGTIHSGLLGVKDHTHRNDVYNEKQLLQLLAQHLKPDGPNLLLRNQGHNSNVIIL